MINILTNSKQETQKLAAAVAKKLRGGEILALQGDLGSGKTAFVQGLGRTLRIRERIQSPTFVIMIPHQIPRTKKKFFHLDLYRLQKPAAELRELGFAEIMSDKSNILAIEWAEKIRKILPKRTVWIKFKKMAHPQRRRISILLNLILILGLSAGCSGLFFRHALAQQTTDSQPGESSTESLTLVSPEKKFFLDSKTYDPWLISAPQTKQPKKFLSLPDYFFVQAGLETPSTNSAVHAKLLGPAIAEQPLGNYLVSLATEIDRKAQNATLILASERAQEFAPDRAGQILDLAAARKTLMPALLNGQTTVFLPIAVSEPTIHLKDLNNLGIETLLARGQSDFSGSTRSRIKNIEVGASRYRGLIIRQGEEFSFNKYLGPVDAAAGFTPELVIKPEGTVPEFGGGLCQVSTTAFRAAFFGGLPITARRNHSYAVRYYEWISDDVPRAVGLDATIYPGSQDMKFINDTPGAILIWTHIEGNRLYFDFYGRPDGRSVQVDGPHPYDRQADGGVKATVTRQVENHGDISETTFYSKYVSPTLYPKIYEYPAPPPDAPPAETPATNSEQEPNNIIN